MRTITLNLWAALFLVSCSKPPAPPLTVDQWWDKTAYTVKDEVERYEFEWSIKRAKDLLRIFRGDDGTKLPYKEFLAKADEITKAPVESNPKEVFTE